MNPLAELTAAISGWGRVIGGDREAGRSFRATSAGAAVAAGYLVLALLLSVAVQSMGAGVPSLAQVIYGLMVQAVTVALLAIAIRLAIGLLRLEVTTLTLLVPAIYGLALVFAVAIVLAVVLPTAQPLAIAALGLMMFRLGQVLGGFGTGAAAAFALACVIVLVAVPNALYMLLLLVPSA